MIFEHLVIGGIYFMLPIYMMWIVVIFFSIKFLTNYFSGNKDFKRLAKHNSLIIFIGSFAFLFGILGQVIGLFQALQAIQSAGDISPALMAGGLRVSLFAPLYGFILFLISSIIWFFNRNLLIK
jgi:hypothetical protein